MKVAYEGIGHLTVTFPNNSAVAGQVCKLSTQGKCEKCSDGDIFCGVVEEVTPAGAAVQLQGFVKLSYTGAIPYAGYTKLSSNGAGGVKTDTNGKEYLVVRYDSAKKTVIIKL